MGGGLLNVSILDLSIINLHHLLSQSAPAFDFPSCHQEQDKGEDFQPSHLKVVLQQQQQLLQASEAGAVVEVEVVLEALLVGRAVLLAGAGGTSSGSGGVSVQTDDPLQDADKIQASLMRNQETMYDNKPPTGGYWTLDPRHS